MILEEMKKQLFQAHGTQSFVSMGRFNISAFFYMSAVSPFSSNTAHNARTKWTAGFLGMDHPVEATMSQNISQFCHYPKDDCDVLSETVCQ